jgi:hypothetical protein
MGKFFNLMGSLHAHIKPSFAMILYKGLKFWKKLGLLAYKMTYNKHYELERSIVFQLIVQLLTSIVMRIKKQSPFIKNFLENFMKLTMMQINFKKI